MNIALGIPSYANGHERFWDSLDAMRRYSEARGIGLEKFRARGCYVEHARNVIVADVRQANRMLCKEADRFSHLLFLDDDMVFGRDLLFRLAEHQKDIAVANYYRKQPPHVPVVSVLSKEGRLTPVHVNPKDGGCHRVHCAGTGICLIRMDVFDTLPFPWFFNEYSPPLAGESPEGMIEGQVLIGEDTRFFMLANGAGLQVWCDFSIAAGHIGEHEWTFRDFERCHEAIERGAVEASHG